MPKEASRPEVTHAEYQALYADRLRQVFACYARLGIAARLVGSLGMAASLRTPITSFSNEYSRLKDIDVVLLLNPSQETERITREAVLCATPVPLEEHFKGQVRITGSTAFITYKDIVWEVSSAVFAEYQGSVFNAEVPTFNPNTLFHLTALSGFLRPKDFHALHRLARGMKNQPDLLPEQLFVPFHELNRERQRRYKVDQVMGNLRWCYHTKAPIPVRKALSTITEPVWHAVKRD